MQPIKVFCSFAPQDKIAVDRLEAHLSILVHNGQIKIWHAGKISPGADVELERSTQLKKADIILLIVSPDYTASHQCYTIEAPLAVQMAEAGIAHVRWIPYRHVLHDEAIFSSCPNLLKDGKFVRDWPDKDKPLRQICQDIDELVSEAYLDRQKREANRKAFGDRLDTTHPMPLMPPLKERRLTKEPEQSKQAIIKSQKQSKQTAILAPENKNGRNTSSTRRKKSATDTVLRRATAQRSLDINLRHQQISRKFHKNRGILLIILFIIDVVALPLTIRSWLDSWLLVVLVCSISILLFSLGTLTVDSLLPIILSLVFAGAWGSLMFHLLPWPSATSSLFFIISVIIIVASAHYMLFRKR